MALGSPRTISYVLPVYWPAVGGCEIHTHELATRVADAHRVRVLTLVSDDRDKAGRELWTACILNAPASVERYSDGRADALRLALGSLEKLACYPLVRVQSPKLPKAVLRGAMEALARFYAAKLLPLLEGSDLVHCVHGGVSYFGYAALKASRRLGIPFVYTPTLHLHSRDWGRSRRENSVGAVAPVYAPKLELSPRGYTDDYWLKICESSDALIAMTEFEREFFIQRGRAAETVHAVGVGPVITAAGNADIGARLGLDGARTVLFLGRNVEYKGLRELLDAALLVWRELPEVHFVFAGPKDRGATEIFAEYQDPRVLVAGLVSEEEKAALLRGCEVFCMPSREESLGATFLEAWSFGKPIIGIRIPPLQELTGDGQGGFLVNPDPVEIADRILTLLRAPELGRQMGEWGRRRVEERYSWDIICERMKGIYEGLLDRGNSAARAR